MPVTLETIRKKDEVPLYPVVLLDRPTELDRYLTHVKVVKDRRGNFSIPVIEDLDGCKEGHKLGLLVSRFVNVAGDERYDLSMYTPDGDESILPVSIDGEPKIGTLGGFIVDITESDLDMSVTAYSPEGCNLELSSEESRGLRPLLGRAIERAVKKNEEYKLIMNANTP